MRSFKSLISIFSSPFWANKANTLSSTLHISAWHWTNREIPWTASIKCMSTSLYCYEWYYSYVGICMICIRNTTNSSEEIRVGTLFRVFLRQSQQLSTQQRHLANPRIAASGAVRNIFLQWLRSDSCSDVRVSFFSNSVWSPQQNGVIDHDIRAHTSWAWNSSVANISSVIPIWYKSVQIFERTVRWTGASSESSPLPRKL